MIKKGKYDKINKIKSSYKIVQFEVKNVLFIYNRMLKIKISNFLPNVNFLNNIIINDLIKSFFKIKITKDNAQITTFGSLFQ